MTLRTPLRGFCPDPTDEPLIRYIKEECPECGSKKIVQDQISGKWVCFECDKEGDYDDFHQNVY